MSASSVYPIRSLSHGCAGTDIETTRNARRARPYMNRVFAPGGFTCGRTAVVARTGGAGGAGSGGRREPRELRRCSRKIRRRAERGRFPVLGRLLERVRD